MTVKGSGKEEQHVVTEVGSRAFRTLNFELYAVSVLNGNLRQCCTFKYVYGCCRLHSMSALKQ